MPLLYTESSWYLILTDLSPPFLILLTATITISLGLLPLIRSSLYYICLLLDAWPYLGLLARSGHPLPLESPLLGIWYCSLLSALKYLYLLILYGICPLPPGPSSTICLPLLEHLLLYWCQPVLYILLCLFALSWAIPQPVLFAVLAVRLVCNASSIIVPRVFMPAWQSIFTLASTLASISALYNE